MPRRDVRAFLEDIRVACERVAHATRGRGRGDYEASWEIRAVVERQFVIMGEALSNIARQDMAVAEQLGEYRRIIEFRNIVVHGYYLLEPDMVWDIIEFKVPMLHAGVAMMLRGMGEESA